MTETVVAVQFDGLAGNGRTGPAFVTCETAKGDLVEVVAKLSARCDMQASSLAMELLGAHLAGDLELPVPEPLLVQLDPDWIDAVSDTAWAAAARRSNAIAYGSKRVPPGYRTWIVGTPLGDMRQVAASVFLFDAIADNADRRDANPNCLVRGQEIRLIDHEMCFGLVPVIGWQPPWQLGALQPLERPGAHIFRAGLRRQSIDWATIGAAWTALSDDRLDEYRAILPGAWSNARTAVDEAVRRLREARDRIDECITEVRRVLT